MRSHSGFLVFGALFGTFCIGLAVQTAQRLSINGQPASADVRMIGGKAYVPVADVAKAFGLKVTKAANGYDLVKEGGAGPLVTKGNGKIGEEIFSGKYRFQVLDMKRAMSFTESRTSDKSSYTPDEGMEFVILNCRVKNATKVKDELVFSKDWEGTNTAILDQNEQGYPAKTFDVQEDEHFPVGCNFLPGAAINFTIVFQVPKGTEVKDLIFTAMQYQFRASFDQKKNPPQDFRVSLKS